MFYVVSKWFREKRAISSVVASGRLPDAGNGTYCALFTDPFRKEYASIQIFGKAAGVMAIKEKRGHRSTSPLSYGLEVA